MYPERMLVKRMAFAQFEVAMQSTRQGNAVRGLLDEGLVVAYVLEAFAFVNEIDCGGDCLGENGVASLAI